MNGIETYNKLARPPKEALKTITGGRLNGKSDINPQWRYKAMTEAFGLCGIGWKYAIDKLWSEQATEGQVFAWAQVSVFVREGDKWSDPVQGIGGNFLVEKEKSGLHSNDEGYKMAITDALGTALKMIGVAADVYAGAWDGSKYRDAPNATPQATKPIPQVTPQVTPQAAPLSNANPLGTPSEAGLMQRCADLAHELDLTRDVYVGIVNAHKKDWSKVLTELKERKRMSLDAVEAVFDGATVA